MRSALADPAPVACRRRTLPLAGLAVLVLLAGLRPGAASAQDLVLEGEVPDDGSDFFVLPFEVPEGTAEIEVRHDDLSSRNVLDWGLDDPDGFRGWGGGNAEPAVVGEQAASRSYLAGPLPAGEWRVVVGKALIVERPGRYRVEIDLRQTATLPPEPERAEWSAPAPLAEGARWWAGDFHVHSRESGDARPTLDEVAAFARSRGLDFVMVSEHNTTSHLQLLSDVQSRHPDLLLMPGIEVTSYYGHANALGATEWIDHRIGFEGADLERLAGMAGAQEAPLSLNHPTMHMGSICIGCGWDLDVPEELAAVEIGNGGWDGLGAIFFDDAVGLWESLLDEGRRVAALGGSDDHRAGEDLSPTQSPIGSPTTLVWAESQSVEALKAGVREGRTVVKLQGPDDPMVTLESGQARIGDTVTGDRIPLRAVVEGGQGAELVLVHDGVRGDPVPVDADPFVHEVVVDAPMQGEDRWRAEVWVDGAPRTVTSHLWVQFGEPASPAEDEAAGCDCTSGTGAAQGGALLLLAWVLGRRRRRAGA